MLLRQSLPSITTKSRCCAGSRGSIFLLCPTRLTRYASMSYRFITRGKRPRIFNCSAVHSIGVEKEPHLLNRRQFISAVAAASAMTAVPSSFASPAGLSHKERVDRALKGEDVDRPPFSLWHHYKRPTAELEAQDHLEFHRRYDTDFVKVMNDFDYPRSKTGKWYELEPLKTPYPEQLHTLELVRDGLHGDAYFVDTLYGPYMTAMLLLAAEPEFAGKKGG